MLKRCIVTSCIVVRNGRILLINHKKFKKWMYPGGHVEENETPIEAVKRETKEETGYNVSIVGPMPVGLKGYKPARELPAPFTTVYEDVHYKTGRHMHFDIMYFGIAKGRQGRLAKGESPKLRWISEKELDGIDTYYSVRKILKYSFYAIKNKMLNG